MINEFKSKEVNETKNPESNHQAEIKAEKSSPLSEIKNFWKDTFSNLSAKNELPKNESSNDLYEKVELFTNSQDRINHTPLESPEKGYWIGERGNGKFVPADTTEQGKNIKEILNERGVDGIGYKDGVVDFSNVSDATVIIEHMTENCYENFPKADRQCANYFNEIAKDGKTDWSARQVKDYRLENKLTWHENSDMKTMELVPRVIHDCFIHYGGRAECRIRDAQTLGGNINEDM